MQKKVLLRHKSNGKPVYPITDVHSVLDDNGRPIYDTLSGLVDLQRKVDKHTATLNEHGTTLAAHGERLDSVEVEAGKISGIETTVVAHTSALQKLASQVWQFLTFSTTGVNDYIQFDTYGGCSPVLYYSYDLISWNRAPLNARIVFNSSRRIYVYGENKRIGSQVYVYMRINSSSANVKCEGNLHCLLDGLDKSIFRQSVQEYCFYGLFYDSLIVPDVELPATTLAPYCYSHMFYGCSGLTEAPELPATTLADYCYDYMFYNCMNLTDAHRLPATTLAPYCYRQMFGKCTGLTEAPELPATSLAKNCYAYMFDYCSGLTEAPELPATILDESCYTHMFEYCTGLTEAPELHATSLERNCYAYMFYNCTSMNYVKMFAETSVLSANVSNMLYLVADTGTFVKKSGVTLPSGLVPSGWTVEEA